MRKRSRFFVANIVLGAIFAVALLISLVITFSVGEVFDQLSPGDGWLDAWTDLFDSDDSYGDDVRYTLPVVQETSAQLLGSEYQGKEAYEGYQFCMVKLLIHNAGTRCLSPEYMDFTCEGEAADDVYMDYSFNDYDNLIIYNNREVIPACQTGWVEQLLQVKEGVDHFTLECGTYDSQTCQRVEIDLGETP